MRRTTPTRPPGIDSDSWRRSPAGPAAMRRCGWGTEWLTTSAAVRVTINGEAHERRVEPRLLLSDFIRHDAGLTGTHVGCEHGVCGACTVLVDGKRRCALA